MICNKCGAENKETAKFCCKCGNPMKMVEPVKESEPVIEIEQVKAESSNQESKLVFSHNMKSEAENANGIQPNAQPISEPDTKTEILFESMTEIQPEAKSVVEPKAEPKAEPEVEPKVESVKINRVEQVNKSSEQSKEKPKAKVNMTVVVCVAILAFAAVIIAVLAIVFLGMSENNGQTGIQSTVTAASTTAATTTATVPTTTAQKTTAPTTAAPTTEDFKSKHIVEGIKAPEVMYTSVKAYVVTDDYVNFRKGPSTDYDSMTQYNTGDQFNVVGQSTGASGQIWFYGYDSSKSYGWMAAEYLKAK